MGRRSLRFSFNIADVLLGCMETDAQITRHFLIATSLIDEFKYLNLSGGQGKRAEVLFLSTVITPLLDHLSQATG